MWRGKLFPSKTIKIKRKMITLSTSIFDCVWINPKEYFTPLVKWI